MGKEEEEEEEEEEGLYLHISNEKERKEEDISFSQVYIYLLLLLLFLLFLLIKATLSILCPALPLLLMSCFHIHRCEQFSQPEGVGRSVAAVRCCEAMSQQLSTCRLHAKLLEAISVLLLLLLLCTREPPWLVGWLVG